ncbi:MAG: H-NS histone family protein [Rubrivivax sp.]
MATLDELLAQRASLERQIIEAQREERAAAIGQIKALMSQFGLTLADLGNRPAAAPKRAAGGGKVAPKYRDPATGSTWTGRGLQPKWLKAALAAGRSLSEFAL